MLYVIIGLGLFFILMGFILNVNNARYLLSGYNTMSEAEREQVDIVGFLKLFRQFHLVLGTSFIGIGLLLQLWTGGSAAGIFIGVYPILAYIYLIWRGQPYFGKQGNAKLTSRIGIVVLILTAIGVVALFSWGNQSNQIVLYEDRIEISGPYGDTYLLSEIASVSLVSTLPPIRSKTSGFATGNVYKGDFKTEQGKRVRLLVDDTEGPFLLLSLADQRAVYYKSAKQDSGPLHRSLQSLLE